MWSTSHGYMEKLFLPQVGEISLTSSNPNKPFKFSFLHFDFTPVILYSLDHSNKKTSNHFKCGSQATLVTRGMQNHFNIFLLVFKATHDQAQSYLPVYTAPHSTQVNTVKCTCTCLEVPDKIILKKPLVSCTFRFAFIWLQSLLVYDIKLTLR